VAKIEDSSTRVSMPAKVWELAKNAYAEGGGCHDISHVERVYRLAIHIGEVEGADLQVLALAALFHDIGRQEEEQSKGALCHAQIGAQKTVQLLTKHLSYDEETIARVGECIAGHRFRRGEHRQRSLESKCLFDADKLDSLGAVGVARAYLWLGERGGEVYQEFSKENDPHGFGYCPPEDDSLQREWEIKLKHLKDRLYTETGRQMARKRHDTMEKFIRALEREIKNEE
jgi:uncharacterized protein